MKVSFTAKSTQDSNFESLILGWHNEVVALLKNKPYFSEIQMLPLSVELSSSMRSSAGKALGTRKIMLNYRLLSKDIKEMKETYIHELAHILCNIVYKKRCGHGPRWKAMMKSLGAEPTRTHHLDVSELKRKVKSRAIYEYVCAPVCGKTHKVSIVRHRKMALGVGYICRQCKSRLSFKGIVK